MKKQRDKENLATYIPASLKEWVEQTAQAEGRTASNWLHLLIEKEKASRESQ